MQLEDNPVRKVCILGEDLVLCRDRSGSMELIGPRCSHRAMHMACGIPEEGWPAATLEAAARMSRTLRQGTTDYRCNFHTVSRGGWKYIEDDVDRYCPDRELMLKLYEAADRLTQQEVPARQ